MIDSLRTRIACAFRRTALPLAAYYAVTLAVPLVNGAARSGMAFLDHALIVLIMPPLIIALASAIAFAVATVRLKPDTTSVRTFVSRPPESQSSSFNARPQIQKKLAITQTGDQFEQDADRVATQVMAMPERRLQRACACGGRCADCQKRQSGWPPASLQMKPVDARDATSMEAPSTVHDTLRAPGQQLDARTRAFMEPRFGVDFATVRVHEGTRSAQSARDVSARAYTVGQHIVFGAGEYAPETSEGRRLLAHELAHVVQQTGANEVALQRDPKPDEAKQTSGSQDLVVLFGDDEGLRTTAAVLAPGTRVVVVTSLDELAKELKAIKGSIRTLYLGAHMLDDGNLMFETPGAKNFVSAEMVANKIKGTAQVENINFQGCSIAQSPMEMQRIAGALKATKATGSTCTLVEQTAPPVKVNGKPITQPAQLQDKTVKAAFERGLKDARNLFVDKKKKCILNDTVDGYFAAGGKLIAYWANPESMADDTGWDDTKSVCYKDLKTQKLDPTKKMPVIDPNDCKLIELSKPKP
jgi:hypothetical protein